MNDGTERFVVFGLAPPRAGWFTRLGRWSTTGAAPVDFVRCVSAAEVRARLSTGEPCSALLIELGPLGVDRDLIGDAAEAGASVIVVDPPPRTDGADLGAAATLGRDFTPDQLAEVLRDHANPVIRLRPALDLVTRAEVEADRPESAATRGRLIAVTGPSGTGTSVCAMALAQSLAGLPGAQAMVCLADLCLDADLAVLHDAGDVVPALQELVDSHTTGRPGVDDTRALTFDLPERGYHLLLGLRRHRDWTAIRRRSLVATLHGLLSAYRIVVADVDDDIEGERETGSTDVEDRNTIARCTLFEADLVVVVGNPTTKGLHALVRSLTRLAAGGVDAERMVPVLNRVGRSRRDRASHVRALATLAAAIEPDWPATNPVLLPERNDIDPRLRAGEGMPSSFGQPLAAEIGRRMVQLPTADSGPRHLVVPERVVPGSLGSYESHRTGQP